LPNSFDIFPVILASCKPFRVAKEKRKRNRKQMRVRTEGWAIAASRPEFPLALRRSCAYIMTALVGSVGVGVPVERI
jgi:hypothetical protein